jgi:serine/threonine-protein kinase
LNLSGGLVDVPGTLAGRPSNPLSPKRFAASLFKAGLLGLALVATAGLSALTTARVLLASREVQVPDLRGQRLLEASARLSRLRLLARVEGRRHDATVPLDHVAAQEPGPGAPIKRQRSVRVWLSLGPRRLDVPAVEGQSERSGRLALEQAGLPVGRVLLVPYAAEPAAILRQDLPAGEGEAPGNEGVALLVSLGPGLDFVMPDLIGRPAGPALDALRRAGLKVTDVRYRPYPGTAPGVVLRQVPASGRRVSRAAPITLEISRAGP